MEISKEISSPIITIIAKALMMPEDDVKLNSKLMLELDAESIDILDIRFGIEQFFGIKFSNKDIKENLERIASETNISEKDIPTLFTVESICQYVVTKIEEKNA